MLYIPIWGISHLIFRWKAYDVVRTTYYFLIINITEPLHIPNYILFFHNWFLIYRVISPDFFFLIWIFSYFLIFVLGVHVVLIIRSLELRDDVKLRTVFKRQVYCHSIRECEAKRFLLIWIARSDHIIRSWVAESLKITNKYSIDLIGWHFI